MVERVHGGEVALTRQTAVRTLKVLTSFSSPDPQVEIKV